jgi:hypothetical protein
MKEGRTLRNGKRFSIVFSFVKVKNKREIKKTLSRTQRPHDGVKISKELRKLWRIEFVSS